MAKPVNEKEDKNPNNKKEINTSTMMIITAGIITIIVVICMLILYLLIDTSINKKLAKLAPDEQEQIDEEEDEEPDVSKQEGVLLDLGDFVLNLADTSARRYIKVAVALELSKTKEEIESQNAPAESKGGHGESEAPADPNAVIIAEMERYKPVIRDSIISTLSNKTSDELSTSIGKEMAKDEITEAVNGIFDNRRKVIRVSFGQFIIQ